MSAECQFTGQEKGCHHDNVADTPFCCSPAETGCSIQKTFEIALKPYCSRHEACSRTGDQGLS